MGRASAQAWVQTANGPRRVTKRAQELFLEVAHYLPERGTAVVVDRVLKAVADALGEMRLDQLFTPEQLLDCLSAIHAGVLTLARVLCLAQQMQDNAAMAPAAA